MSSTEKPGAAMKPRRPYLLRALHEWIVDSDCTPHLLVDAERPGVIVPRNFVQDGRIVLNVAPRAVRGLQFDDAWVTFECRFGGAPMQVELPMESVLAIYARETGAGMAFEAEPAAATEGDGDRGGDDEPPDGSGSSGNGPNLRVVK